MQGKIQLLSLREFDTSLLLFVPINEITRFEHNVTILTAKIELLADKRPFSHLGNFANIRAKYQFS